METSQPREKYYSQMKNTKCSCSVVTIAMGEVEKRQPRLKLYANAVVVSSISQH
jgi:hypothetical protein